MDKTDKHIKEKSVVEHLAKARQKGYLASVELHNFGFSSKLFSFNDALRDGIILFSLLYLITGKLFLSIALGFALWKGLKMTLQGFMRLERLHFLVKEEKYEIEHHREEEKQELMAIYAAKGFKGPILDEVVATLMADDNRLLQVMLEEEMGISFETLDHPVVTGSMAFFGTLVSFGLVYALSFIPYGIWIGGVISMVAMAVYETRKQKLPSFSHMIWSIASLLVVIFFAYFIHQLVG